MKLLILSDRARSGKDTVAEILRDQYGYSFKSSSKAAMDIFLYDILKPLLGYTTREECFEDRVNHRALWYELIRAYNYKDPTRLAKSIFEVCDIYVGLRNIDEFYKIRDAKLYDLVVWVDASSRVEKEGNGSNTLEYDLVEPDFVIDNNGSREKLDYEVEILVKFINNIF